MLELFAPVASIPWYNIVLILLTAVLSSALIVFSTQRSVRSIGLATAKMVASIEASHKASQQGRAEASDSYSFLTTGRGEVRFYEGGYTTRLRRRYRNAPDADSRSQDEILTDLAVRLIGAGISAEDIRDEIIQDEEGTQVIGMAIDVREPSLQSKINEVAIREGFRETEGREEITESDAHHVAGIRALIDAERNIVAVSNHYDIPRANLQLVSVEMDTVGSNDNRVIKIARTRWQRSGAV